MLVGRATGLLLRWYIAVLTTNYLNSLSNSNSHFCSSRSWSPGIEFNDIEWHPFHFHHFSRGISGLLQLRLSFRKLIKVKFQIASLSLSPEHIFRILQPGLIPVLLRNDLFSFFNFPVDLQIRICEGDPAFIILHVILIAFVDHYGCF